VAEERPALPKVGVPSSLSSRCEQERLVLVGVQFGKEQVVIAVDPHKASFHATAIVSLTLPAVIGPVDELLGGTPDLVWQRALTVHARFGHELWSAVLVRRSR
jgi:hypothetical protein